MGNVTIPERAIQLNEAMPKDSTGMRSGREQDLMRKAGIDDELLLGGRRYSYFKTTGTGRVLRMGGAIGAIRTGEKTYILSSTSIRRAPIR